MIEYEIKYICDFIGCGVEYTKKNISCYFNCEVIRPTLPTTWVAVTEDGVTHLYCSEHSVKVDRF